MKLKMVGIFLCGSLRGVARFPVNYVIESMYGNTRTFDSGVLKFCARTTSRRTLPLEGIRTLSIILELFISDRFEGTNHTVMQAGLPKSRAALTLVYLMAKAARPQPRNTKKASGVV